ncbi:MAG: HAMP domain-containing histidine kinase [Nitrospirae bacterium]|nr:HAMP domain-containing histidine kinase [Nitrospirota bacterium]
MKTKIFCSFITIIIITIFSNVIFRHMIVKDFDDYIQGIRQTNIYWLIASVESSYEQGNWNEKSLMESLHWGLMLGEDIVVFDVDGKKIMDSAQVIEHISPPMRQKMEHIVSINEYAKEFKDYDIFALDKKIGRLKFKPLVRKEITAKEDAFKEWAMKFMIVSFTIASAGSLLLALLFSTLLSLPLKRLREGATKIADGDFDVRIPYKGHDEVSSLTASFNYMAEALKRESDIRKHVMANVTHQLRTPLTIINANAEAIIDCVAEPMGATQNIKAEAEKLIGYIKSIEDLTRAEASFFERSECSEFNLKVYLSKLVSGYKQVALNKSLDISFYGEDMVICTDGEILTTILDNLISNAIKYTNEGGIYIENGRDADAFHIKIKDTGIGIPLEELPLVFERFYKGRSKGQQSTGVGIGLSIVKELVSVLKGKISIKSIPGQGTEVTLTIPY